MALLAGHDLLSYSGVGTSSSADGASAYTDALNALDGSCKTCASINGGSNYNYFMVRLPVSWHCRRAVDYQSPIPYPLLHLSEGLMLHAA